MADTHNRNASESRRSILGGEGDEGVLGTALTVEASFRFFDSVLTRHFCRHAKSKLLGGK